MKRLATICVVALVCEMYGRSGEARNASFPFAIAWFRRGRRSGEQ